MQKRNNYALVIGLSWVLSGCSILGIQPVESPRPKPPQIDSAAKITLNTNKGLIDAHNNDAQVLSYAFQDAVDAIAEAKTPLQVEGITKTFANYAETLQGVDGLPGVSKNTQLAVESILTMPFGQYMAYVVGQNLTNIPSQQLTLQGIKAGWEWTGKTIALAGGGTAGVGGLIAFGVVSLIKAIRRRKYLLADGEVIEEKGTPELKAALAKSHSSISGDAKKEHGIT